MSARYRNANLHYSNRLGKVQVCADCGALVRTTEVADHDTFHRRFDDLAHLLALTDSPAAP